MQNSFKDLLTNGFEIADFLNYTFSNPSNFFRDKNVKRYTHKNNLSKHAKPFGFQFVTKKVVYDAVRELSSIKPLDPCTVPASAIKDCQTIIYHILHFDKCIKQNNFPDFIKKAEISSIYKRGDRMEATN